MKRYIYGALATVLSAGIYTSCASVPIKPPVTTPPLRPIAVNFTQPITNLHVWFDGAGITTPQDVTTTGGRAGFPTFPANGANPSNVHIRADGYLAYDCITAVPDGSYDFFVGIGPVPGFPPAANGYGQGWFVGVNGSTCPQALTPAQAPIPPPPTRDQALLVNLTFQGLMVHTGQFGDLHWFGAALPWLNADDRQAVYAAQKAQGDTHTIIEIPDGKPVYDECCNDFSPDRFGALDWTSGGTKIDNRLADLVVEVRRAGLIPLIFPDEADQPTSLQQTRLAVSALQSSAYGDLTPQVAAFMTGWDGVFYGWEPSGTIIPAWAAAIRQICPLCRLGIEFNTGHIPLGEGGGDYLPGGRMQDFDLVLDEFGGANSLGHDDNVWQILGRMNRPYNRPSDQPAADDPNPPFYLGQPNPRGPFYNCAFEFGPDEYNWVRGHITKEQIDADRAYLKAIGVRCVG
jgi:hypothetical protein